MTRDKPPVPVAGHAGGLRPDPPRKRSLTLQGHRTSVSLEDAFWRRLVALAARRGRSVNALVAEIDAARDPTVPLASVLRVYLIETLSRAGDPPDGDASDGDPPDGRSPDRDPPHGDPPDRDPPHGGLPASDPPDRDPPGSG